MKLNEGGVTVLYEAQDEEKNIDGMLSRTLSENQTMTEIEQTIKGQSLLNRVAADAELKVTLTKGRQEVEYKITAVIEPLAEKIDASNLERYLNRKDVVYIDLREEGPGRGTYQEGYLQGFINLPYNSYIGKLFINTPGEGESVKYVPVYEESVAILEALIPQDKNILFMCQGGVRAEKILEVLESIGYDISNYRNISGWGQFTDEKFDEFKTSGQGIDMLDQCEICLPLEELTVLEVEEDNAA